MDSKMQEKVLALFPQISILKSFSSEEIKDKFFKKGFAKIVGYAPGEIIISEGKYDNWVYWLIDGKIDVVKNDVRVAEFRRVGDMFGEMGILEGDARSASVMANSPVVCLSIDMSILDHPELERKISREAFCNDVAHVTKKRLARTTSRLTVSEHELLSVKDKLAETDRKWHSTMETLSKTLDKLEEKDAQIKALKQDLAAVQNELQKIKG